jgi:deazaflavin-dependent oxidoreductase (nitroreductase family)
VALFDVNGLIGRAAQRMAATPVFAQVAPLVVPPLDRTLHRLTGGRFIVGRLLVPSLVLTTTGRRSGEPRDAPLACLPADGGWYVVGSNFGRAHHPAWTGNLIATPEATVSFQGRTTEVVARQLSEEDRAKVWPRLVAVWPLYDTYEDRAGRGLRVFHLTPAPTR